MGGTQSSTAGPVAVIVPVGIDAVVGDVTVAAVVLTDDVDEKVIFEQVPNGVSLRLVIRNRAHNTVLADFSMKMARTNDRFEYSPGGLALRADSLLGKLFSEYVELPNFSTVVGFCPKSEEEMGRKLQSVAKHLTKIVRDKYPTSHIQVSPQMFNFNLKKMWESGCRSFPSIPTFVDDEEHLADGDILRLMFAHLVAEALATGVRSARCMDHGEIYPVLRLENNLGYSCSELFHGLGKIKGFEVRGLRDKLTERWLQWATKNLDVSSRGYAQHASDAAISNVGFHRPYKDSRGRDAINLPLDECKTIIDELQQELDNNTGRAAKFRDWSRHMFPSIGSQFKAGKLLSGRQMYILWALFNKKIC